MGEVEVDAAIVIDNLKTMIASQAGTIAVQQAQIVHLRVQLSQQQQGASDASARSMDS